MDDGDQARRGQSGADLEIDRHRGRGRHGAEPAARSRGCPRKIILANLIADANFVVAENSPIKSLADLKGKKIGSTPPGSTMHALVGAILQGNYGLKESDFQQIPSGEAQLLPSCSAAKSMPR